MPTVYTAQRGRRNINATFAGHFGLCSKKMKRFKMFSVHTKTHSRRFQISFDLKSVFEKKSSIFYGAVYSVPLSSRCLRLKTSSYTSELTEINKMLFNLS